MSEQNVNQSNVNEERDVKFLDKHGLHTVWYKAKKYIDAQDAKLNEKKIDKVHGAEDEVPVFDDHGNLKSSTKTIVEHKYDPVTGEVIADYEGNLVTGHAVEEALDDLDESIQEEIDALDTKKADKVKKGNPDEDLTGKVVLSDAAGNLVSAGKTVMNSAPVDAEGHVDYTVFNGNIPSGKAVVDAIEDLVNRKDADVTSIDGRNLNVRVVEENGAITEVHVTEDHSATRLTTAVEGDVPQFDSNGDLGTTGRHVVDSLYNEAVDPESGDTEETDTEFTENIPTGKAVQEAIDDSLGVLDKSNEVADGKYITSLSQNNGQVSYTVGDMDTDPINGSAKPVTSGGVKSYVDTTVDTAVNSLDVADLVQDSSGSMSGKTLKSLSEENGKISATFQDISIVSGQVTDKMGTYDGTGVDKDKVATGAAIKDAIDTLDIERIENTAGKTIATITEADGKVGATFQDIAIVSSQVTDKQTNTFDGSAETLTTGKAVKAAIDALNGTVQASSTNVSVSVTETAGKLTGITVTDTAATADHVHGEINNDGTIGATADLAVVTGESGAVTVADLSTAAPVASGTDTAFVTTVSQDSKGKITAEKANLPEATTEHAGIVQLVDSYESNSTTMAPTANALKAAYDHSSQVIADLDYTNKLGNGQYITDLKQVNGLIDYGVGNMATQPVQGDMKPITSGGVQHALLEEHDARVAFDTKIDSYLPDAVSSSNKLADKAYVDAIGERLEARYLASSDQNDLPFPTKAAFDAAQAANPPRFYYEHQLTTPDNNDVVVVTADESKIDQSTTGVAPTTRYRFIAHKVQATDEHGDPLYDPDTNEPIWELDSNEEPVWVGSWYFEYVINNSALNQDQLLAINSGITPTKRSDYDNHVYNLAPVSDGQGNIHYEHQDHMNPHGTTYTQTMQSESGLDTTATELQSLHGLDTEHVGAAQFNALAGLNLENNQTIQNQLDVKADRVFPKYDTSGYSVAGKIIVGADTADQNGRYNIVDSGYGITQNYVPGDVSNVTTGSSITQAIQTLDATVSSATENKKVSVTVVEDDGKIKSVSVNDDNAASAAQGAKADTAIQNVIVHKATGEDQTLVKDANQAVTLDLSGYKPLQGAVSDPTASSEPTLEFISNITQDANGVISPVKNAVKVSSNYVVDGTDPVNGTAVTAALNTLDAEVSSTKDVGIVSDNIALKITEVNGKVTEVLVTKDNTVNTDDIATAIEALDYTNPLQAGDYIKEISEVNGIISVNKEAMDTAPVAESKKPITSGGVYSAIAALDATNQVSAGDYITAVNETDGKVSIVTDTMDTTPSANSQKPVTSGGVKTELDKKADKVTNATANDIVMLDGNGNIADTGRFITNQYLDPDTTKTEEERRQMFMSNVPTGTAVKAIVDEAVSGIHSEIDALDATVSSADGTTPGTNVDVQVVESNGVITGVNIVRDDSINATDLSTAINALDATVASDDTGDTSGNTSGQNVDVQVVETNGKITGVNIIRDDTANAHDIENTISDLNAEVDSTLKSGITKSNIGLKVTETAGEVTELLITKDDTVNAQDVSSAITTALDALDLSEVGGSTNTYISAISETNGQVSATATQMNTSIMDKSGDALQVAPTTGAVKSAIESLDVSDTAVSQQYVSAVSEADGKITVSRKTFSFSDIPETLGVAQGGTGATSATDARTNLDVYSKGEVDSMVSGHGKFLGNLTATEINNLTSISNSDTVICVVAEVVPPAVPDNQVDRGDGTYITVRDGEQLIVSDKSGTPLWESVTGKFKLTQQAYSDARTSDDFSVIDGLTQNANGEVTTTRHSLSDASNIGGTATHGLMSATDKVKLDALPDRSDLDNSLAAKADKVSNATAGNFAALDANGNLADSGHKHSDYKTVQTAVSDPSASGSTLAAIDTISQNANGEITVTKKTIQDGTTEQKGVVQLAGSIGATVSTENNKAATEKAVRDAINDLDVSNITGFDKGKTLATLTETNGKIAATFQDIDITSAHVTDKQTTTFDGTAETLTTGKAVKSALDTLVNGLDAEVTSTDGTNVQVKVTETNGKITAVNVTTDNTENKGNKVSSWSSTLTDGHYPSEKLVKTELDKKADKLTTATADNFASFDVNGNLKDSGHKHSDYKTKQTAVETATADTGSTLTFISSVTQDTNGVITPKTKTVTVDSTYSADGTNPVNGTAVAAAIGTLDSEKTGTGTNVTVKVKEVDGKIDSVTVTDTSASSTHVHGNITNDGKISLSGTVQTTKSVVTDATGKVTTADLTTAEPSTDGTGTAFITSVSQGATGKISATKAALPTATVPSGSAATGTAGIVSLSNATNSNSQTVAATSKAVSDLATSVGNAKADKVSGTGLNGHLAGLDANGNLTDSGIAASSVKTKQSAKTDPTASGNTLSFIDSITQDSNGEITATKKNVTVDDTYSADGTNPVNGKAVAHALGTLDATVTGMAANKTVATLTETDGKIAATFQDIHISMSQVDDFAHAHGNISYEGEIDSSAVTIGSGDSLVFTDSSNSNKVEKSSVTFDGSTTNQFLSKKGTWSDTVANATNAVNANKATNDVDGNPIKTTYVKVSTLGEPNGVATLGADGKVPAAQLPGYVDDVIDGYYYNSKFYSDSAHTQEITPETGKVYVDVSTNVTYRWGGSSVGYVVIGSDLALGETHSTAYYGDLGKAAYDHSQITSGNPHNVTLSELGVTASAAEINKLDDLATTKTELGYVHGVTSSIQDQLNSKATGTHVHGNITNDGKVGSTANLALVTGTSGAVTTADLTTEAPTVPSSGTTETLEFIDSISQDSKGKITASKKKVKIASTYSASGTDPVNGTAVAAAIGTLDATKTSTDGTNVQVKVTEADGKITAVNVTTDDTASKTHVHGNITNDGKIGSTSGYAVYTTTGGALTASSIAVSEPTASGTSTSFIATLSQDAKGQISTTKANLPTASTSTAGIAKLSSSTSSSDETMAATPKAVKTAYDLASGKITKVSNATAGNVPTLNASGELVDSGTALSNLKTKQTAVADPTVPSSGTTTSLSFIDTISQNTNGVITATKKNVAIDSALSSTSTNPVQNKIVQSALSTKIDTVQISASFSGQKYLKMTVASGYHHYLCFFNESLGNAHAEWLMRTYGDGGTARTTVNIIGGTFDDRKWYVAGSSGTVFYITLPNNTSSQTCNFRVASLDGSALPTLEWADSVPSGFIECGVQGVGKAEKLRTARQLAVNLANTSTTTTFDGSADQTGIKVSGTLPVANGGTGATTAADARTNLGVSSSEEVATAITTAINALDVDQLSVSASETIKTVKETDGKIAVTKQSIGITSSQITDKSDAYSATGTVAVTGKAIAAAIGTLDGSISGTAGAAKTLTAFSQNDGIVSATFGNISIPSSQINDKTDSYSATGTAVVTGKAIAAAISTLDGTITGSPAASKTLTAFSETDGIVSATFADISITKSQVSDFPSTMPPSSHTHGNITNAGGITADGVTIASGDALVIVDSSDTNKKVAKASITFDGSTATKALTQKGTWETFNNYTHPAYDAATAAAKKIGRDATGHVVIGDALTKSDVGLGSVVNTGDSATPVSGGTTKFTTGGAYTELNKKADKTSTVTSVDWDSTNKKLTKTINGTASDVVTASTLKTAMALNNVDNTSDATKKTNFTGSIASGNTGFVTGGAAYTALSAKQDTITWMTSAEAKQCWADAWAASATA